MMGGALGDLAEAQSYTHLGFTFGWKLEAESLQASRDKETLCSMSAQAGRSPACLHLLCHGCARLPVQASQKRLVPRAGWN